MARAVNATSQCSCAKTKYDYVEKGKERPEPRGGPTEWKLHNASEIHYELTSGFVTPEILVTLLC